MKNIVKTLKPGTKLNGEHGEYVIDSVLGYGSFGITYKARCKVKIEHVTHTVNYAIKEFFISSICSRDEDGTVIVNEAQKANYEHHRKAFVKEARMLYELPPHEGIVKVNGYFDAYNTTYYVMEFLEESLTETVTSSPEKKLTEAQALNIFTKLALAVSSLHDNHRLHLDIKPANIMINDGMPKLIDFGQSRVFDEYGSLINKDASSVCSDGYSPVEQYKEINHFRPTADIYSLGATLLFMLTGENPVPAKDMNSAFIDSKLPETIGSDTRELLHGALATDHNARYRSIAEMLSVIGIIVSNDDGSETRLIGEQPSTTRSSKRGIKIAACIAAIVVVAALVFAFIPKAEDKPIEKESPIDAISTSPAPEPEPTQQVSSSSPAAEPAQQVSSSSPAEKPAQQVSSSSPAGKPAPATAPKPSASPALDYAKWTGKITNGKPEGSGTMTFTKSCRIPGTSISVGPGDVFTGSFYKGVMVRGELNGNYIEKED